MDEKPQRPWYSFRWTVLLWIIVPLAIISLSDIVVALLHSARHK